MKLVILAGGGGTRLFPLSRTAQPKQFLSLAGEGSLFANTAKRFFPLVRPEDIIVITNKDYYFHVKADLASIDANEAHIICEPVGKNTAPAIALAVSYALDKLKADASELIFVTPSDHLIAPEEAFRALVQKSEELCKETDGVTVMGVVPTSAETGYGYIKAGEEIFLGAHKVEAFKEKPDKKTAEKYLADGGYYWNAGMYLFSIKRFQTETAAHAPEIFAATQKGFDELIANFASLSSISVDYAVAEKSDALSVMPLENVSWNDIGSFDAIYDVLKGEDTNAVKADAVLDDCENTLIMGEKRLTCAIGVRDLLIVDTPDVLLVSRRGDSQKVKELFEKLKKEKRPEVETGVTVYRPWGAYTVLSEGPGYKVKKITVNPGQAISLQMHHHRSEHWTVIEGTGKLNLDDKEIIFTENESAYIPIGARHRLSNPGLVPLSIIEVQNGKYLGEDDIVRLEDIYNR